jgi:outer membrane protease
MNNRNVLRGLALALSLGVALPAMAADLDTEETLVIEDESIVTFTGGIGIVSLEANEFVYAAAGSDTRLSQLIWQSTAPMLTGGLDVALPEGWTLSAKGQVALSGDSYMEDYDWIAPWATGRPPAPATMTGRTARSTKTPISIGTSTVPFCSATTSR